MLQEKEVILITGSSGRIGTSVASRFSDDKYQLVGLDIVKPKKPLKNLDYIYADLTSDVCMNKVMDEKGSYDVKIKMIKIEGSSEKVILTYNNKEYYYAHISWNPCCGSGTDSFILLNNVDDMNYFDEIKFEVDMDMQKHFEYLKL